MFLTLRKLNAEICLWIHHQMTNLFESGHFWSIEVMFWFDLQCDTNIFRAHPTNLSLQHLKRAKWLNNQQWWYWSWMEFCRLKSLSLKREKHLFELEFSMWNIFDYRHFKWIFISKHLPDRFRWTWLLDCFDIATEMLFERFSSLGWGCEVFGMEIWACAAILSVCSFCSDANGAEIN